MKLDAFLSELAHAVVHAADVARLRARDRYLSHFDKDGSAETCTLHGADVPHVTLSNHDAPRLGEATFEIQTDLVRGQDGTDVLLSRSLLRRAATLKLRAVFVSAETPEGIHLTHERLHNDFRQQARAQGAVIPPETNDTEE